jgi:hypothetical protein
MLGIDSVKNASAVPQKSSNKDLETYTQKFPEIFSKNAFAPVFRSKPKCQIPDHAIEFQGDHSNSRHDKQ